jgi:hypothetical protein
LEEVDEHRSRGWVHVDVDPDGVQGRRPCILCGAGLMTAWQHVWNGIFRISWDLEYFVTPSKCDSARIGFVEV